MKLSVQNHSPAALSPRKIPDTYWILTGLASDLVWAFSFLEREEYVVPADEGGKNRIK
jgi:hypothetical protein